MTFVTARRTPSSVFLFLLARCGHDSGLNETVKIYLDDNRPAPVGWTLVRTADEAIAKLRQGNVTEVSLDYDLGDPQFGTGLDVLDWLEHALLERRLLLLPRLTAHSGSLLGRRRLETAIALLEERWG